MWEINTCCTTLHLSLFSYYSKARGGGGGGVKLSRGLSWELEFYSLLQITY